MSTVSMNALNDLELLETSSAVGDDEYTVTAEDAATRSIAALALQLDIDFNQLLSLNRLEYNDTLYCGQVWMGTWSSFGRCES